MKSRVLGLALATGALLLVECGGGSNLPDGLTLPEPAPGLVPQLAVSAEAAASSPLPEIAVRRLNGDREIVPGRSRSLPLRVWRRRGSRDSNSR